MNHLRGARVYLSGPMDFVASRADEKASGWRNRVGDVLRSLGAVVFDPWFKPSVRGLHQYGLEDVNTIDVREHWTFESSEKGDETRSGCADKFWETLHIDLRMVDTSDFTIAYVPTNIYSVGTAHESFFPVNNPSRFCSLVHRLFSRPSTNCATICVMTRRRSPARAARG